MRRKYAALYEAISKMTKGRQETIIRLYGLFGNPEEGTDEIGDPNTIRTRASYARKQLRKLLEGHLQQMLDLEEE